MDDIKTKISHFDATLRLKERLLQGESVAVRGPVRSAAAVIVSAIIEHFDTFGLVICPGVEYAEEFTEDAALLNPDVACFFPARESAGEDDKPDNDILRSQLRVLSHLTFGPAAHPAESPEWFEPRPGARLVCTSINAVLQPVVAPQVLHRHSLAIEEGEDVSPRRLVEWLVEGGFISMPQVTEPGHYSLRGGILDVFPFGAAEPVRMEFFGDEVDSMRNFDPGTQLSGKRINGARILASPAAGGQIFPGDASGDIPVEKWAALLAYLPEKAPVFLIEPDEIWRRGEELADTGRRMGASFSTKQVKKHLKKYPVASFLSKTRADCTDAVELTCELRDVFGLDTHGMVNELKRVCESVDTYVLCAGAAEEERLDALLDEHDIDSAVRPSYMRGRLNHGVVFPSQSLALVPHHRLFGRYRHRRQLRQEAKASPVSDIGQLRSGDYVVHINYGIGRFRGTRLIEHAGRKREHLEIEFADRVKVHVPADRLELVHRYVGVGDRAPRLSKIRGSAWEKRRKKAEKAAEALAAELLRLQAVRRTKPGLTHPKDDYWQKQFEAEFPYEETEDQLSAIAEVKSDMQSTQPMDRLICGDVGYGKTEVAMRAAFRCVTGGRQVAVVAPTTVLAQQHRRTFRERMADYPVRVEMLSRFVPPARTVEVLEDLAGGKVDVVIGTHRLLQKDVVFQNLGLLVIDEEQRFGVKHKEKLKRLRVSVDILTLTATPIPRTLHMAMTGLRDISALQTPPLSRRAVETHVSRYDPDLVRNAILRELNREGQVYVVHNRVKGIEKVSEKVRRLVPEATVGVGHGQMPEKQLSEVMDAFSEGELDVLVSTTIIENGLDIPNANTLIIDRAELLGLAEMHQLRGRVGRYIHKAYAYFLTPPRRPVTPEARKRLDTIRHYSELGAGFDIALRDLELRGAGNILGPQQSGHIAAVGYHLYCRLLSDAQEKMKGGKPSAPPDTSVDIGMEAFIPEDYVPALSSRIEIYRRLGDAASMEEIRQVARNLRDRFGSLPECAENLMVEAELRLLGYGAGLDSIQLRNGCFRLGVRDLEKFKTRLGKIDDTTLRLVGGEYALLEAPEKPIDPLDAAGYLCEMLGEKGDNPTTFP